MLKLGEYELETPSVCASIIDEFLARMREDIEKALEQNPDIIELRLDKLHDYEGWKELLPEGTPVIITNRAEREGGHFEGTESERIEILLNAINQGVACVDIELSTPQKQINKILNAAKDTDTSVITSFHDFEDIPPIEELIETAQRMEELEGSIGKIIGFTKNFRNGMKILDFLLRVPEEVDIPIISFAMGKAGRYTRIMSALFGSPIVYAAVEEKTAPGQFDVKTTRSLLEVIK